MLGKDIKKYKIYFSKYFGKNIDKFTKSELEEAQEIYYTDNFTKKIEDLKLYLCDLFKFKFCPCKLKIFNYVEKVESFKYYNRTQYIEFIEVDDNELIYKLNSKLKLNSINIVEIQYLNCNCSKDFKIFFIKSKFELIKTNVDDKEKISDLTNKLMAVNSELNEMNSRKNKKENIKNNYEKKINELEKKNLESEKNNLKKDETIKKLTEENQKIQEDLKNLNENHENVQNKVNILEKDNKKNKIQNDALSIENRNLKIKISQQNSEIERFGKTQNENDIKIHDLENLLKTKSEEYCQIKNKLNEINSIKVNLEKNLQIKEDENKNLQNKVKDLEIKENTLTNENNDLKAALMEDPNKLKQLHDLGFFKGIEISDNATKINTVNNKIMPNFQPNNKTELKNFYDIIINITSVKDISTGWRIEMTKEGEENFLKFRGKDLLKIGVIGNSNKGKSFILERISKIQFPSAYYINTKGLSIKYPDLQKHQNRNYVLLDSAGLETPVLDLNNEEEENDKENNINKDEKKENEKNDDDNENDKNDNLLKKDAKNYFMEKSREKLITESFLQNYIIFTSNILIIVVGILTYTEQKLINKILNEIKNSNRKGDLKIFIIHNLKELFTIEQVENYIKKTLLNSSTFKLKEREKISSEETSSDIKVYKKCYEPIQDDEPKKLFIRHLIFANEDSEAGKFYNNYSLELIERQYDSVSGLEPFDVFKTIKDRYIEHSKDFIDNNIKDNNQIEINDEEDIIKNRMIRLKNKKQIILKKCLIDEYGLWNLQKNSFEPKYHCYKNGNKIFVIIEIPGEVDIEQEIKKIGEYTYIMIKGKKEPEQSELNNIEQIVNKREFGEFYFDIKLKYQIKHDLPKNSVENGILTLEYDCEEKIEKFIFSTKKRK